MPRTERTPHAVTSACLFGALLGALTLTSPLLAADTEPRKSDTPGAVEVRFLDGSVLRLLLREDRFEVVTASGRRSVPLGDVRKIELANRIPDDLTRKIAAAIERLGNDDFKERERAAEELFGIGVKAYPALAAALKRPEAEVRARAEQIIDRLKAILPEEILQVRTQDVVHTAKGEIIGRIEEVSWRATTAQFGDVRVKLADVDRVVAMAHREPEEKLVVQADPGHLIKFQGEVGKVFAFRVTGAVGGTVWGSDVYTSDSPLATAAVHAGVLAVGQTGTVKVRVVPPPPSFTGTTRNGVTTSNYGPYQGAYQIVK
jgi:hypothetical protein